MGRRKKEVAQAGSYATDYVLEAIRRYPEMKKACVEVECQRPYLLQRCGIKSIAFEPDQEPSKDVFVTPLLQGKDGKLVDAYLEGKEKLYLLERGIAGLDEELRNVAEALFLDRLSRPELEQEFCLSQSTITRRRNEAIRLLAIEVEAFMEWKTELLFA